MDRGLKERLIGAAVLVALAFWLIPWALNGPDPTEEADVRETLELPAAQGSSAPVRTHTVYLDENRTPAEQIEANVELSANPAVGSFAGEVEPNLPSEPQRLVEVENAIPQLVKAG